MPERSQQLLALQALDTQIGRLTRQIEQATATLSDDLKSRAASLAIRQTDAALQARQREQREREYELAQIEARLKDHEQRLYSGKGSPRDLQALQRDIEHDRIRKGEVEEQVLAAMEATDQARAEVARMKAATERVLSQSATDKQQLSANRDQLQGELTRLQGRRAQIVASVDPAAVTLYDRLRQRMPDGIAVAEVVQGNRCEGCRTSLPSAEVQHARRSDTPVLCSACGRIIHVALS